MPTRGGPKSLLVCAAVAAACWKSPRDLQRDYAQSLRPAPIGAQSRATAPVRSLRVRAYADPEYQAQTPPRGARDVFPRGEAGPGDGAGQAAARRAGRLAARAPGPQGDGGAPARMGPYPGRLPRARPRIADVSDLRALAIGILPGHRP